MHGRSPREGRDGGDLLLRAKGTAVSPRPELRAGGGPEGPENACPAGMLSYLSDLDSIRFSTLKNIYLAT